MQKTQPRSILLAHYIFIALGGSLLLAASAHLEIPLLLVPVTFQTMALLVLAVLLGPQLACAATVAYLIEGFLGAPVFASTTTSATLGYLVVFPVAAFIAGRIAEERNFYRILLAGVVSALIVLTAGTLFLVPLLGLHKAFTLGFAPFVLIEVIKVLAVASGVSLSTRLSKKSA